MQWLRKMGMRSGKRKSSKQAAAAAAAAAQWGEKTRQDKQRTREGRGKEGPEWVGGSGEAGWCVGWVGALRLMDGQRP